MNPACCNSNSIQIVISKSIINVALSLYVYRIPYLTRLEYYSNYPLFSTNIIVIRWHKTLSDSMNYKGEWENSPSPAYMTKLYEIQIPLPRCIMKAILFKPLRSFHSKSRDLDSLNNQSRSTEWDCKNVYMCI